MAINQYRRRAIECLCIADELTTSAENRILLLDMAQAWLKLAQRAEQNRSAEIFWHTALRRYSGIGRNLEQLIGEHVDDATACTSLRLVHEQLEVLLALLPLFALPGKRLAAGELIFGRVGKKRERTLGGRRAAAQGGTRKQHEYDDTLELLTDSLQHG